jgi:hypothetical protein
VPQVRQSVPGPKKICFRLLSVGRLSGTEWIQLEKQFKAIVGASPGFPVKLVTPAHFMRLSLLKAAYAVVSSAAYRKSGSPRRFRPTYAEANVGTRPVPKGFCKARTPPRINLTGIFLITQRPGRGGEGRPETPLNPLPASP